MKIIFSNKANQDFLNINNYLLKEFSFDTANNFVLIISKTLNILCDFPDIARDYFFKNKAYKIHIIKKFSTVLIFRINVSENELIVIRFFNTRQDYKNKNLE